VILTLENRNTILVNYQLEGCVEDFAQARAMEVSGVHQVELCSRLDLDGCTPLIEDVTKCLSQLDILTKVMIRPYPGPFVFDASVFDVMKQEIREMKAIGVKEVVYGITTPDQRLDIQHIAHLRDLAYPMEITIHKAIDTCDNIVFAIEELVQLGGIKSVLTSGGAATAELGQAQLKKMIGLAAEQIEIIPAGKITPHNIRLLHQQLQATTYHGRRIVDV